MDTNDLSNQYESNSNSEKQFRKKLLDRIDDTISDRDAFLNYFGDLYALQKDGYNINEQTTLAWKNDLEAKLLDEAKREKIEPINYIGFHKLETAIPILEVLFYKSANIECIAACASSMWKINKFHDEKRLKQLFFERANDIEKRVLINAFRNIFTKESNNFIVENCEASDSKLRLISLRALRYQVIETMKYPLILAFFLDRKISNGFNLLEDDSIYLNNKNKYIKQLHKMQSYCKV
ncbi:MAG: hypothetical protein ABI723_26970 [Bacteroidia bacterium]